jgi:hypothetical protein
MHSQDDAIMVVFCHGNTADCFLEGHSDGHRIFYKNARNYIYKGYGITAV